MNPVKKTEKEEYERTQLDIIRFRTDDIVADTSEFCEYEDDILKGNG